MRDKMSLSYINGLIVLLFVATFCISLREKTFISVFMSLEACETSTFLLEMTLHVKDIKAHPHWCQYHLCNYSVRTCFTVVNDDVPNGTCQH